jgi:hypothetical protein
LIVKQIGAFGRVPTPALPLNTGQSPLFCTGK